VINRFLQQIKREESMSLASKPQFQKHLQRRIWKTPLTRVAWFWLLLSIVLYGGVYLWYLAGLKSVPYPGPSNDPFRLFGIIAFGLVLMAAYSLRRRFVRVLPGSVQGWLWLHTWFGISAILIALLHENYQNILNSYSFTLSTFREADFGMSALYALLLLVFSGIVGRLLDTWLARIIATEASSNGVGIIQAVEARIHELDLLLERLYAGKSTAFKHYCIQVSRRGKFPHTQPQIMQGEQGDFQQAHEVLTKKGLLQHSLNRQKLARRIIQWWRYVHVTLACGALGVISYHSVLELAKMVLQLLGRG